MVPSRRPGRIFEEVERSTDCTANVGQNDCLLGVVKAFEKMGSTKSIIRSSCDAVEHPPRSRRVQAATWLRLPPVSQPHQAIRNTWPGANRNSLAKPNPTENPRSKNAGSERTCKVGALQTLPLKPASRTGNCPGHHQPFRAGSPNGWFHAERSLNHLADVHHISIAGRR